ncbi:uncharacterized protein LOC106648992 [Trichogramma pretiosum]|uniref:uncharacterized protein LOC106648992 n=1 Tax=Trichogramma pretiosum TaxID=7493 RepID=UPI0006C969B5|nr:uncharacterized protein LOC106648992 [Trichogramma pretiosum]XP_014221729.1 uncharacterized protein LOC106648992 [Trichogramma pretiosum]XP_014221730.1 uncharacterized protein LOC106648992 [Trichogramma pretiosum]
MTKGGLTVSSIAKMRPPEITLKMECIDDELSPCQLAAKNKHKKDFEKVSKLLESIVKEHGGTLLSQSGAVMGHQYQLPSSAPPTAATVVKPTSQAQVIGMNQNGVNQPIKLNMINSTATPQGNIQLVMDPRMGPVLLGTVAPQQVSVTTPASIMSSTTNVTSTTTTAATSTMAPIPALKQLQKVDNTFKPQVRPMRKTKHVPLLQPDIIEEPSSTTTIPITLRPTTETSIQAQKLPQNVPIRVKTLPKNHIIPSSPITSRPTEQTSIGCICIGNKIASGEIIDESTKNQPDGREVSFNKVNGGKTYPSLVVVARPSLKTKNITPQQIQKERGELDQKVKAALMHASSKFTEWLIQQGLVRSEQHCDKHPTQKLKLGMYSDSGTFPCSGGYVWISSCCPERFVSVFCGSIFQGAPHSPTALVKLIYHWACQTNVQNVISWVKVTNFYVKTFYSYLRSVCTSALHNHSSKLGGRNSIIQVGVISLGTTSQDGNLRQVKVEVLGILDPETLQIRLRACEPVSESDKTYKRRFDNILHSLQEWVHKESRIITDYTVDKNTLNEMGFFNVCQSALGEQGAKNFTTNFHVMEYLRKIVPRMFQNTLSLLSRPLIQQFLDELVWREQFGTTSLKAFDNIIHHIQEQTKIENSECNLLERLAKIAANPFADWSYKNLSSASSSHAFTPAPPPMVKIPRDPTIQKAVQMMARQPNRKRSYSPSNASTSASEPKIPALQPIPKDTRPEHLPLQEYFYATMQPEKPLPLKDPITFSFKCFLCSKKMSSNTEVMEHMISHVPARVPGQSDPPVCRYCCTTFSSNHQMNVHISEGHSNFGKSDSDMFVCAICEQKFGSNNLLVNHLSSMHHASEMPYCCHSCGYRTSSHRDVIDHYYEKHDKGKEVQCPLCIKVFRLIEHNSNTPNPAYVHTYLMHMQRHIVRRDEKLNKCPRCCLWFNQMSLLKAHVQLHCANSGPRVKPCSSNDTSMIVVNRSRNVVNRYVFDDFAHVITPTERVKRWYSGPMTVNAPYTSSCKECEEDVDMREHYPGEQKCQNCRYVTCCWRAFKEHQKQIHNERPLTSVVVPSPLLSIPLDHEVQCSCDYKTLDGNKMAAHLIKCGKRNCKIKSKPVLDSLGLVPRLSIEIENVLPSLPAITITKVSKGKK